MTANPHTATSSHAASVYAAEPPRGRGPIVVATDGSDTARGAVVVGHLLGARLGVQVRVLGIVDAPALPAGDAAHPDPGYRDQRRKADRLHAVRAQVRRVAGEQAAAAAEVHIGAPAHTIARIAAACDARVIVIGLGRHRLRERVARRETAVQLARLAGVPILAVPAGMRDLPVRAVVATDFSDHSTHAAGVALDVLERGAIAFLAYVSSRAALPRRAGGAFDVNSEDHVSEAFLGVRARLSLAREHVVKDVVLHGDTVDALLRFADDTGADLIAAGSHGHGFLERLVIGSVTTALLRGARSAVLVAPPCARLTGVPPAASP